MTKLAILFSVLFIALGGCANDPAAAEDFYNQVMAGSTSQLAFGAGAVDPQGSYTGACPAFGPKIWRMPGSTGDCDTGYSCQFQVFVSDQGPELAESTDAELTFLEHGDDGSQLICHGYDLETGNRDLDCFWDRGTVGAVHDCGYPGTATITF